MLKSGIFIFALLSLSRAASSDQSSSEPKSVNVHYHIWVGDDVGDSYSTNVKVDAGSTFFDAMNKAAEDDARFAFTYTTYSFGRFITSIGGVSQTSSEYWLIYILQSHPKINKKPGSDKLSNVGVDEIIVDNGVHYLFWLNSGTH